MKNYVLIFVFNRRRDKVLMIKKTRNPEHHIGLLNGIGGKIDGVETATEAAEREFTEESGIPFDNSVEMERFGYMRSGLLDTKWYVHCFWAVADFADDFPVDTEEGAIRAYDVADALSWRAVSNIPWLVPMAYEASLNPDFQQAEILYKN